MDIYFHCTGSNLEDTILGVTLLKKDIAFAWNVVTHSSCLLFNLFSITGVMQKTLSAIRIMILLNFYLGSMLAAINCPTSGPDGFEYWLVFEA